MEYQNMRIQLNKEKSIGKVLYIIEGAKTEPIVLHRIFCNIFDYQVETILRNKGYHKYNSKDNPFSQVFVINAEESNIKHIAKDNEFLNNLFKELIETYDFDVDNAAIYYLFDRDNQSNTDTTFINGLISELGNSRDNEGFNRQGLLLLSYPSIEAFTLSNFENDCFEKKFKLGKDLKQYLHACRYNQQHISEESILHAITEMFKAFDTMNITNLNIDSMEACNGEIFKHQENEYKKEELYNSLSLLSISLLDLGLIEIDETS